MKSRDDILADVAGWLFSRRASFWRVLDGFRQRTLGTGEAIKITWPDALLHITLEQWNAAYNETKPG